MPDAYAAWSAESRRLAADYRVRQHGPGESDAFQAYMDGCREAWARFAIAEPGLAEEMFAASMLAVSRRTVPGA